MAKKTLSVSLDTETADELRLYAAAAGKTQSEIITEGLTYTFKTPVYAEKMAAYLKKRLEKVRTAEPKSEEPKPDNSAKETEDECPF